MLDIEFHSRWDLKPVRSVVAHYTVSSVDKVISNGEQTVKLCNYSDVYNNEFISSHIEFMRSTASEAEIAAFSIREGDVLITKDSESWDDIGVPALVVEAMTGVVCGYHLALLRPDRTMVLGAYLLRCLQARPVQVQLELAAQGITRFGIPKSAIGATLVPVPPIRQQRAIANYLDRETARLDALVTEKNRLRELLVEKRHALMTCALTRGVHRNVSLRDSCVEWLGEIPKHWDTKRARWLFQERDQRSETGSEELLTVSHLTGVTPRAEKNVNMFEAESTKGYKKCVRGDLVINTLWAWMGAMGVTPEDGIVSPAYNVYEPVKRIDPAYIDALVRLPVFAQEATRHSKGVWSSRLRLYPEEFFTITLPVPPLSEQGEIVAFLAKEGKKLDSLIEAASEAIDLSEERRGALIEAVITGTLDIGDTK